MFQEIIHRAQQSIDSLVNKYVSRLVVAVPFLVAAGFGTAAASNKLSEVYGSTGSHTIMAIAFAVLGSIAAAVIAAGPRSTYEAPIEREEPAPATAEAPGPQSGISADLALTALGALGPSTLTSILRNLARNLPLVIGVVIVGYLLFSEPTPREREAAEPAE